VATAAAGLPAQAAAAVRSGVGAGVGVANKLGSATLLDTVRTAFVHGMDIMLWTCGGIALGCAVLALVVLGRRAAPEAVSEDAVQAGGEAGPIPAI
jgi:hypothetical protein